MKLLWRKAPQPAFDLCEQLKETEDWSSGTVKTLLNRLLKKGALSFEKYKNLYLYSPEVSEDECIEDQSRSFLDQVFDGSLSTMMVHFAKRHKMSKKEITALRKMLDEMEK